MADSTTTHRDAPEAEPSEVPSTLTTEERKTTRLCLTVLGVLGTGSMVGVAFSLYLVNHHPLLLVALSPLGRHLLLVAPIVDPLAFVTVTVGRRMLFYLTSFHLGRALGPLGIPWIEACSPQGDVTSSVYVAPHCGLFFWPTAT